MKFIEKNKKGPRTTATTGKGASPLTKHLDALVIPHSWFIVTLTAQRCHNPKAFKSHKMDILSTWCYTCMISFVRRVPLSWRREAWQSPQPFRSARLTLIDCHKKPLN